MGPLAGATRLHALVRAALHTHCDTTSKGPPTSRRGTPGTCAHTHFECGFSPASTGAARDPATETRARTRSAQPQGRVDRFGGDIGHGRHDVRNCGLKRPTNAPSASNVQRTGFHKTLCALSDGEASVGEEWGRAGRCERSISRHQTRTKTHASTTPTLGLHLPPLTPRGRDGRPKGHGCVWDRGRE